MSTDIAEQSARVPPPPMMPPPAPGTGLTQAPTSAPATAPSQAQPTAAHPQAQPATQAQPQPAAPPAAVPHPQTEPQPRVEAAPAATAPTATSPTATSSTSVTSATDASADAGSLRTVLLRGAIAGPIAMGAAALLQMWSSAAAGDEAARALRMMTVPLLGGSGLVGGSPILGVLVNVLLGAVLGVLFAVVVPRLRAPRQVLLGALVLGAGVFVVDQYVLSPLLSPVLELRDAPGLLAARLVFGAVLAVPFLRGRHS